jgi:hypothetical protein
MAAVTELSVSPPVQAMAFTVGVPFTANGAEYAVPAVSLGVLPSVVCRMVATNVVRRLLFANQLRGPPMRPCQITSK